MSGVPSLPKIYHIVHVDRLPSIVDDGHLWCDAETIRRSAPGTPIGMPDIKSRRRSSLLASRPGLHVGDCVPFYFCARSIMLYLIYKRNHPNLGYRGGQGDIVHLEADLQASVDWAEENGQRWAFTLSNAGSLFFEDRCDLAQLGEIDWEAVQARDWSTCKDGKQAEFLVESSFPWRLIERIGVQSSAAYQQAVQALPKDGHRPRVEILPDWYY